MTVYEYINSENYFSIGAATRTTQYTHLIRETSSLLEEHRFIPINYTNKNSLGRLLSGLLKNFCLLKMLGRAMYSLQNFC